MSKQSQSLSVLIKTLNPILVIFAAISLCVLLLSMPPSVIRDSACGLGICFVSHQADAWNSLLFTISSGCLITVVLFWLLVSYPDFKKRQRLKSHFADSFKQFKLACIENFLCVADGGFDVEKPTELLPAECFKDYFNEDVGAGRSRWDEVANKMTPYYLEATVSRIEIFRSEILFLLSEIDLSEKDDFRKLKAISDALYMQRNVEIEYDSMKSFLRLFWQLFSAWSWSEGYQENGVLERLIEQI